MAYIQIKLTKNQALAVLDLLEDELEEGDKSDEDRPSLEAAVRIINKGIDSLEARLKRMANY